MTDRLGREQLLELLAQIGSAKARGLTEQQADQLFLDFCAGCPDPVKARWLYVECLEPMHDEELVARALGMPLRLMADVPATELPSGHPLRAAAR